MGQKVKIDLTVDAHNLFALQNPTQQEIDNCCSMSDDSPDDPVQSGTIENYTTTVYINNDVEWDGETKDKNGTDKNYKVDITAIEYEPSATDPNDVSFFDATTIQGNGGKVTAKVKNDQSLVGKHDVYKIYFDVEDPSNNKKSFSIDPKLQGHG